MNINEENLPAIEEKEKAGSRISEKEENKIRKGCNTQKEEEGKEEACSVKETSPGKISAGSRKRSGKITSLRGRREFRRVLFDGKKYAGRVATAFVAVSSGRSKFGVVTGKKVGGAVQRSRARRIIREVIRSLSGKVADGFSIVLLARSDVLRNTLDTNKLEIGSLLLKAGCVRRDDMGRRGDL